jgi:hypothetical protein
MRDHLHVCISRSVLRAALLGAVLVASPSAMAQGKVLRPEIAAGVSNPDVTPDAKPAPVAPVTLSAAAPARPEPKSKTALDPNAPEPLSERAQAALDRANNALAAEDSEDFVPDAPQAVPVGQPVKVSPKAAVATATPAVKCVAGC